ncbi:hypothetical protein IEQ34_000623 [Dendrobium chrysotoxum]|uniref:Uncharacterized protein n=1 Tax=Dendrobium chrysotoxum TaxID=161865 RepID=A0AAV7HUN9_DENCH|nr:hypothetical protein IEQ34_000623 [Dendrobium chrysotoxum]
MSIIFIGLKGYCYAYMMTCWVPISMEVVRNNLYAPRNNPSLVLEMDEVAAMECRKWVRETNEIVIVKKPKMKEGLIPYYLLIMPTVFLEPNSYCYGYMRPWWVPISMEFAGLDDDGYAGGSERVRCGCQARAFSGVELWRSGVQKKGEGDHLNYHSEEARNGGGTNALLFTGYCYAYMKPYWVPISMKVVGNNLYEPMLSAQALAVIELLEVVEECGVEVRLELSLGLSSSEVKCRKWVRETDETVVVKNLKMEEGLMPYCL